MGFVFEVVDKTGRKIHLSKERWSHIRQDRPTVEREEIENALKNPIKISPTEKEDKWFYYYRFKHREPKHRYLRVIVKYLNGGGFVITSYFLPNVK